MNVQKNEIKSAPAAVQDGKPLAPGKDLDVTMVRTIKRIVSRILSLSVELVVVVLASIVYPFAAVNFNPKLLPPTCKKVTILVHGFLHNRTAWVYLKQRFEKHPELGPIFTINLGHPFQSIEDYTEKLKEQIESIRRMSPDQELEFNLVGHSMGGLVCANFVACQPQDDPVHVANVVTISSPLKGTTVAKAGAFCPCAEEMEYSSPFVKNLQEKIALVTRTNFFYIGLDEDVIVPKSRAFFGIHNHKEFKFLGHVTALLSPKVANYIIKCLRSKTVTHESVNRK
ncbi:MAG: alpha/beta hydrolase [Parachlamydiaceae bacterium]|nr:alpha/beta hydrolase [Parachlamydiaceae bacterium]